MKRGGGFGERPVAGRRIPMVDDTLSSGAALQSAARRWVLLEATVVAAS